MKALRRQNDQTQRLSTTSGIPSLKNPHPCACGAPAILLNSKLTEPPRRIATALGGWLFWCVGRVEILVLLALRKASKGENFGRFLGHCTKKDGTLDFNQIFRLGSDIVRRISYQQAEIFRENFSVTPPLLDPPKWSFLAPPFFAKKVARVSFASPSHPPLTSLIPRKARGYFGGYRWA